SLWLRTRWIINRSQATNMRRWNWQRTSSWIVMNASMKLRGSWTQCYRDLWIFQTREMERKMANNYRNEVAHHFGRVLKDLRNEAGLTQEMLAERACCDRTYPSLLERGSRTPSLDVILRLADGLKVDAGKLVELTHSRLTHRFESGGIE